MSQLPKLSEATVQIAVAIKELADLFSWSFDPFTKKLALPLYTLLDKQGFMILVYRVEQVLHAPNYLDFARALARIDMLMKRIESRNGIGIVFIKELKNVKTFAIQEYKRHEDYADMTTKMVLKKYRLRQ